MIYHEQHYLWQFSHTSQAREKIIANLLLPVQFQSAFDTYPAHKNSRGRLGKGSVATIKKEALF